MPYDVKTLCPYCGVGCGLVATTDGRSILKIKGDPAHPANFGKLCAKGGTVDKTVTSPNRMKYGMLRETRSSEPMAVSSSRVITEAARRLNRILQTHGPQAIGFYVSGQLTNEAQYFTAKFAKACLRTNHIDSNNRLCMSSAASGLTLSLGSDGPPTCYADIELADTFMFVGSNAADCHPITFDRVQRQMNKTGAKCIVVDPRRTPTAAAATVHLQIKPGTDIVLLNGLLRMLIHWGKVDTSFIERHTEGWDALAAHLEEFTPAHVVSACGITAEAFLAAAKILAAAKRTLTFWSMGVNQTTQGTFTSNTIINLHLATGQIGKPGCGPFSLTGQPNGLGGRDAGYMAHQLPGQRLIANVDHRLEVERFWGLSPGMLYPHSGYDAVDMFSALDKGELRAIWIIGTNPAATLPNLSRVRRALQNAELVIVQDAYGPTETSVFADIVFPAAVNLEQSGTFTNSERCITLMEQVIPPPGEAKPDWWWVQQVASAMGFRKGLGFTSSAQIFDELAASTAGRPNDFCGMSHDSLSRSGPMQWPLAIGSRPSYRRYTDGVFPTPSGRARFWPRPHIPPEERPEQRFPLLLTTGRLANQWHTRTKTGQVPQLNQLDPSPFLQMHPRDATELGLYDGQRIQITSRRGLAWSILQIDELISPGVVFHADALE